VLKLFTDYVYLRSLPGDLEDDDLVAILRLAHFWELSDTFQQIQQLIVDTVDIYNYEYRELFFVPMKRASNLIYIPSRGRSQVPGRYTHSQGLS
jgi:hypothetical protein